MIWFIIIMLCLIVVFGYMSKFRCFTSYTGDIDKARNEYEKWKKFYEKSTNNKIKFVLGGSSNHLCLLDLKATKYNGNDAEQLLKNHGIICNRNTLLGDTVSAPTGVRLGTAYMTSKGWGKKKFYKLGQKIGKILN